jgi:hypothetical protein
MNMNVPEVPRSYAPNSCTHQDWSNSIQFFTSICMKSSKDSCSNYDFCQWNGDVVDCPNPNTKMVEDQCGSSTAAAVPDTTTAAVSTYYSAPFWNTK